MISFLLIEVYLLASILFAAGHDATSYLLKGKDTDISLRRINRWHRDGLIINILMIIPVVFDLHNFSIEKDFIWILSAALLIRLTFFDFAFNHWAILNPWFIGGTAKADKFFAHFLGQNGGFVKALIFLGLLTSLNALKYFIK